MFFTGEHPRSPTELGEIKAGQSGSGDFWAEIELDQAAPTTMTFSAELYKNKIPDACAYKKRLQNAYLSDRAVVGNHPDYGQGIAYTRTRINYFFDIPTDNVLSVAYHVPTLSASPGGVDIELKEVKEQWSSSNLNWWSKAPLGQTIARAKAEGQTLVFDITNYAKECLKDFSLEKESIGLALQAADQQGYAVVASSDHPLYAPYIRIRTKSMPGYFVPKDDINEQL